METGPYASQVTRYTEARYPLLRKYHVGLDPLEREALEKKIEPTSSTKQHVTNLLVKQMGTDSDTAGEAGRLTVETVNKWRQKQLLESLPKHVDAWFAAEFMRWLRGVSVFNSRAVTPWGTENLLHIPEVLQYLREALSCRADFQRKLVHLSMDYPRTLNDAYLYYKYIVMHYGWTRGEPSVHSQAGDGGNYAPQYMTIGGMLDFLDDFSQTTFLERDMAFLESDDSPPAPIGMGAVAVSPEPDGTTSTGTNAPSNDDDDDDSGIPDLPSQAALNNLANAVASAVNSVPMKFGGNDDDDDDDDDDSPDLAMNPQALTGVASAAASVLGATYSALMGAWGGAGRAASTPAPAAAAAPVASTTAAPPPPPALASAPITMRSPVPAALQARLPDLAIAAKNYTATQTGQTAMLSLASKRSIPELEDDIGILKTQVETSATIEEARLHMERIALAEAALEHKRHAAERDSWVTAGKAHARAFAESTDGQRAAATAADTYSKDELYQRLRAARDKINSAGTAREVTKAIVVESIILAAAAIHEQAELDAAEADYSLASRPSTPPPASPTADVPDSPGTALADEFSGSVTLDEAKGITAQLLSTLPAKEDATFRERASAMISTLIARRDTGYPVLQNQAKKHVTDTIGKLRRAMADNTKRAPNSVTMPRAAARKKDQVTNRAILA